MLWAMTHTQVTEDYVSLSNCQMYAPTVCERQYFMVLFCFNAEEVPTGSRDLFLVIR